jgi:UDP-N-acetylmuramoyl-tripeptide--D-alanyl-D-alanine ligase
MRIKQLLGWLEHGGKQAVKSVYRRPVIESSRLWRRMMPHTRYVGITGSAGKTTTKDLLHAALASQFRSTKNSDSNNQLYGVARTLLGMGLGTQYCVQEVGAGDPGGFDPMLELLRPQVGVVTNIGTDHLSVFRNREGVAAEKGKLIACLPADGIAVLNSDDELVTAMAANCRARVVTYALQSDADYRGEVVNDRWPDRLTLRVSHAGETELVQTRLVGAHQAGNVLAALATACSLGVPLATAALAIREHEPLLGRMSVHPTQRGVTFIRDDWKAPNWSLPKALDFMARARATRKLLVLGTISDSGGRSNIYRRTVKSALESVDVVLLVGPRAAAAARRLIAASGGRLLTFQTALAASEWLIEFTRPGDLVLLKGSNTADHLARLALAMDRTVRCWRSRCARGSFCDACNLLTARAVP